MTRRALWLFGSLLGLLAVALEKDEAFQQVLDSLAAHIPLRAR